MPHPGVQPAVVDLGPKPEPSPDRNRQVVFEGLGQTGFERVKRALRHLITTRGVPLRSQARGGSVRLALSSPGFLTACALPDRPRVSRFPSRSGRKPTPVRPRSAPRTSRVTFAISHKPIRQNAHSASRKAPAPSTQDRISGDGTDMAGTSLAITRSGRPWQETESGVFLGEAAALEESPRYLCALEPATACDRLTAASSATPRISPSESGRQGRQLPFRSPWLFQ